MLEQLGLSAPLFLLVLLGYLLGRWGKWPESASDALSRFVFVVALPAMLFHLMSDFSKLPKVDARLLLAFFGGCLLVFAVGRLVAWKAFGLNGIEQSVFALGGIFSNNVMLGLPIARLLLGEDAIPAVALVLVFNALILWTLVTVSVEWSRHGHFSVHGFVKTLKGVLRNPLIQGILAGTAFGFLAVPVPGALSTTLSMLSDTAAPMALVTLGMGLAQYRLRSSLSQALAISAMKLVVQPFTVWCLAVAIGLPAMERQVVVLLSSTAVGVNVYLMAKQFKVMESAVAGSLVLSTVISALTIPLALALGAP